MTLAIPHMRSRIEDTPEGLLVVIPAKRNYLTLVLVGAWLCGWCFGEVSVIQQIVESHGPLLANPFLLFWLVGWTFGGLSAGLAWLWMLVGEERVLLGPDALEVKRDLFGLGRRRRYALSTLSRLRVGPSARGVSQSRSTLWRVGNASIAFDYGPKTIRFGTSLDEPEARTIVQRLKEHYTFLEENVTV